jgi:uncharacterized damage-inducible protein DinB
MIPEHATTATKATALEYLMSNYANYNLWANTSLISWLKTKPAALLEQDVPSSFRSIYLTLLHIWQTERYWLSILKKEAPVTYDDFSGSLTDLYNGLLNNSAALAGFVNEQTDIALQQQTRIESPWFQCQFNNFEYVMQVMNHSTYHRGQIVTMGRYLGFTDAPMTDYNFYNIDGKEL